MPSDQTTSEILYVEFRFTCNVVLVVNQISASEFDEQTYLAVEF